MKNNQQIWKKLTNFDNQLTEFESELSKLWMKLVKLMNFRNNLKGIWKFEIQLAIFQN